MKLTFKQKSSLPKKDFAVKGTGDYDGKGSYPIPDENHARDALARSSGKPEHAEVVAAVKKKFPKIKITRKK